MRHLGLSLRRFEAGIDVELDAGSYDQALAAVVAAMGALKAGSPGTRFYEIKQILREHKLHSVCEEASCPNIGECFSKGTATFMIMGDICTRRCPFCDVGHGTPLPPDADEPRHLAETIALMALKYVVITSVDRDDLRDGGAQHFVDCGNHLGIDFVGALAFDHVDQFFDHVDIAAFQHALPDAAAPVWAVPAIASQALEDQAKTVWQGLAVAFILESLGEQAQVERVAVAGELAALGLSLVSPIGGWQLGVPLSVVFQALQASLGGYYVNDMNLFGRTWKVQVQAEAGDRPASTTSTVSMCAAMTARWFRCAVLPRCGSWSGRRL